MKLSMNDVSISPPFHCFSFLPAAPNGAGDDPKPTGLLDPKVEPPPPKPVFVLEEPKIPEGAVIIDSGDRGV